MRIPRHWAKAEETGTGPKGQPWHVAVWGWSDQDVDSARGHAAQRLATLLRRLALGDPPDRYGYLDRPMREEIVEDVAGDDGAPVALITRTAYGALVLNAAQAMFVDIDLPRPGFFARIFGRRRDRAAERLAELRALAEQHPGFAARAYRTAAGLRLLVTHRPYEPGGDDAAEVFARFGCDPLYARLCRLQDCFRARLTPKPWRIGLPVPPGRWPFAADEAAKRHRAWCERYAQASRAAAACRPLGTIGGTAVHAAVAPVLELHDRLACSGELPLA